ncbi:MAG: hypothetical protein ABIP55_15715, partial [Tepidisphaeraceae bacterium]
DGKRKTGWCGEIRRHSPTLDEGFDQNCSTRHERINRIERPRLPVTGVSFLAFRFWRFDFWVF